MREGEEREGRMRVRVVGREVGREVGSERVRERGSEIEKE